MVACWWNWAEHSLSIVFIPPVYEEYRGYVVFAFSVCVCVCVCVFVCKLFLSSKIPQQLLDLEV